jgi:hypothetical protein
MIEVGEERKGVREDCCRAVEGREVEKDKSGIRGGGVGRGDIRDCFRGWLLGCAFGFLVEGSEREFEAAETEPLLERRASRSVSSELVGWRESNKASLVSVVSSVSSDGGDRRRFLDVGIGGDGEVDICFLGRELRVYA